MKLLRKAQIILWIHTESSDADAPAWFFFFPWHINRSSLLIQLLFPALNTIWFQIGIQHQEQIGGLPAFEMEM